MSKRRTRKQKIEARHQYTLSWKADKNELKNTVFEPTVKRQIINEEVMNNTKGSSLTRSEYTEQLLDLASIRKDMIKSLTVASFILASEIVLYFVWQKI